MITRVTPCNRFLHPASFLIKMDFSVLDKIKKALLLSLPKDGKAVLYGSQARGDNRHDSDWDILVVVDKERLHPEDYDAITYPLTKLGWDLNVEINPIMYNHVHKARMGSPTLHPLLS